MKRYKVIALRCNGIKKVFRSGDVVMDSDFPSGHAEILVEQNFLKPISKNENEKLNKEFAKTIETAEKKAQEKAAKEEQANKETAKKKAELNDAKNILNASKKEAENALKADVAAQNGVDEAVEALEAHEATRDAATGDAKKEAKKAVETAKKNLKAAEATKAETAEALEAEMKKIKAAQKMVDDLNAAK